MKKLRLVTAAVMAVLAATCFVGTSHAGWGSYGSYGSYGGSSGGSYGSYGGSYGSYSVSYGSSGYGSSGYSRPGLLARIATRVHNHFHRPAASYGSYGSSGYTSYSYGSSGYGSSGYGSTGYGSSGYGSSGYGSYGSSSVSYSTSYGSTGYGSYGSSVSYSGSHGGGVSYAPSVSYGSVGYSSHAPVYAAAPSYSYDSGCSTCGGGETIYSTPVYDSAAPAAAQPTPAEGAYAPNSDEVLLTVNVPEGANVFVNGNATRSTGAVRQFVSRGLQNGKLYDYEVRVEGASSSKPLVKRVSLRAGENRKIAFEEESEKPTSTETTLTLHVPENAQVTLAGNKTTASGTDRVFRTTDLPAGKSWEGYTVVVSVEVDGQVKTEEKTLTLVAGNEYELAFEFDAAKVAMR